MCYMVKRTWHGGLLATIQFHPAKQYQGIYLDFCEDKAASGYVSAVSLASWALWQHLFCSYVGNIAWSGDVQVHPKSHHIFSVKAHCQMQSTHDLCCIRVCGPKHSNGPCIISECMELISKNVEGLWASSRWGGFHWLTWLGLLSPTSCHNFTWQFLCLKCITGSMLESPNLGRKLL